MNDELTPPRAGCRFVSSFFIHTSAFAFCAREQTHFGRTLDDGIIGNQTTILRDEIHRAGAAKHLERISILHGNHGERRR
jgi:hypothetical protein